MDRNTKLAVSLVAVLVVVGMWAVIFHQNKAASPIAKSENTNTTEATVDTKDIPTKITYITGVVEVRDERGEWTKAEKDMPLRTGMGLRTTGAASRAIATLDDGTTIRLDANTEAGFKSLSEAQISIEQESGYVYNRIVSSTSRKYEVITENAQFESVGTAFRTIASGDEEAVEVFQNSVKETIKNKTVQEGERLVAKSTNNSAQEGKITKIDIEKLKEDDFITWNRELDSQDDKFKSNLGFLKDFDGPKIDITDPAAGTTIEVTADSPLGGVSIKGKTESKTKLTVQSKSLSGSAPVEVIVQPDGTFDSGILTGPIGTSVFEFIAKDEVGNTTKLNVNYVFKKQVSLQQQGIALTVKEQDGKAILEWGLVGMTTPNGVKVLYAEGTDELTYKNDAKETVSSGSLTTTISGLNKNKTYSFAVCRYNVDTDSCDVFSNTAKNITIRD
jgi:hypothetical protein